MSDRMPLPLRRTLQQLAYEYQKVTGELEVALNPDILRDRIKRLREALETIAELKGDALNLAPSRAQAALDADAK